jgi:isocitrate lyase
VVPGCTFARLGAERLWPLLTSGGYVRALGALTGGTCRFNSREFALERDGYTATRHQREVGAGYFDRVMQAVSGGEGSTLALQGSTEEAQFA